jgi:DNA-binding response OmpR family regulator
MSQILRKTTSLSMPPIWILSISAVAEDHADLRRIVKGMHCRVTAEGTCKGGLRRLEDGDVSVVVCERDLPDGAWRDILGRIRSSPEKPSLIVTSRVADEWLWAEVLNLGGFDVIAKPFNARETRHVLETACMEGRRTQASANLRAAG